MPQKSNKEKDKSKPKRRNTDPAGDAAAEAAAAAQAELDSMGDAENETTKANASKNRAKPGSKADNTGSLQNVEENSSGEDDGILGAGPAPAAAAQTRHVNGDQARQIADLERRLAAAQVTIQR